MSNVASEYHGGARGWRQDARRRLEASGSLKVLLRPESSPTTRERTISLIGQWHQDCERLAIDVRQELAACTIHNDPRLIFRKVEPVIVRQLGSSRQSPNRLGNSSGRRECTRLIARFRSESTNPVPTAPILSCTVKKVTVEEHAAATQDASIRSSSHSWRVASPGNSKMEWPISMDLDAGSLAAASSSRNTSLHPEPAAGVLNVLLAVDELVDAVGR
eukprot:CAMPEP_0181201798 /NCGR_PEP_ID=MMETSP1096-20121128/18494_1 /TAXON_ID=156174 ORGANISM="Chrysochromulina ericina, Strain CCMP281" /NCGR_SAMPLE_ID=MMETSP1096 /ASSEMBLY_ACC=CAM_ASM_000453 /LENGTH=217 /DNA_ID=CAMNT_0023292255 /DNA_START=874 /DNA_END=1528 /DNA_ORIENTATION=+